MVTASPKSQHSFIGPFIFSWMSSQSNNVVMDPASNMISGICYEHHQNAVGYLKLDNECHVASEALVVMAQPYDNINYLPIPLIIIPSCKCMPAATQIRFLQQILGVWDHFADQGRLGELLNVDSDGQPQRRQAFHHIFSCIDIRYAAPGTSGSKLWAVVSQMCLMDSCCGVRNRCMALISSTSARDFALFASVQRGAFMSWETQLPVLTSKNCLVAESKISTSTMQQGTDTEEFMFGHMRTLTHNRNFNLAEANVNLSTAHQISHIFEEHPEWSRGHWWLNATEDKVNPLSWRDDVRVTKHLDIPALYNEGMKQTKSVIIACGLLDSSSPDLDFYHLAVKDSEDSDSDWDDEDMDIVHEHPNIDGKQVHKSTALRLGVLSVPKSMDRTRQVAGASRFTGLEVDLEDWHLKAIFLVRDTYAVLVSCGGVHAQAVLRQTAGPNSKRWVLTVSNMTPDQLLLEAAQVTGSLMKLVYAMGESGSESSFTWNVKLVFNLEFQQAELPPLQHTHQ
eukprot:Em0010g536a